MLCVALCLSDESIGVLETKFLQKHSNPDIVHLHHPHPPPSLSPSLGVSSSYHIHMDPKLPLDTFKGVIEQHTQPEKDHAISTKEYEKKLKENEDMEKQFHSIE